MSGDATAHYFRGNTGLEPDCLLVMLALADQADWYGVAIVSLEVLAARCSMSTEQMMKVLGRLVQLGEIDRGYQFIKHHVGVKPSSFSLIRYQESISDRVETVPQPPYKPVSMRLRTQVLKRDGHRCVRCGTTTDICIDHIIPRSKGGLDDLNNLQALCRSCNSRKGDRIEFDVIAQKATVNVV
jgi:hypothetical protein